MEHSNNYWSPLGALSLKIHSRARHTVRKTQKKTLRPWPPGQYLLRDHFLEARAPKMLNRLRTPCSID